MPPASNRLGRYKCMVVISLIGSGQADGDENSGHYQRNLQGLKHEAVESLRQQGTLNRGPVVGAGKNYSLCPLRDRQEYLRPIHQLFRRQRGEGSRNPSRHSGVAWQRSTSRRTFAMTGRSPQSAPTGAGGCPGSRAVPARDQAHRPTATSPHSAAVRFGRIQRAAVVRHALCRGGVAPRPTRARAAAPAGRCSSNYLQRAGGTLLRPQPGGDPPRHQA